MTGNAGIHPTNFVLSLMRASHDPRAQARNSEMKPLAIDLFCGCFGWSAGWLELGGYVVGFDLEHLPHHGPVPKGADLVIQDVLTLHGSQFRDASLILASPPCQFFSYCAMPWDRAKKLAQDVRADPERTRQATALFDACFRIQREAIEAAGHHIPLIVENVRGAIPWVGRSRWNYGSFHLWGDVPALMPITRSCIKGNGGAWFKTADSADGKYGAGNFRVYVDGVKNSRNWWSNGASNLSSATSSKSPARKAASAAIAKIPRPLAQYIARTFRP